MKTLIVCVLLKVLIGVIPPLLPAQQSQNTQKSNPEIEALKQRVSTLEILLQTVENVEKMELQAKLAEANTKLLNAEFGKFERELRDSNNEWLKGWSTWFLGVIGFLVIVIGGVSTAFWFWLRSRADGLIADRVEKSLNGFKEGLEEVDTLKNEIGILKDQQRLLEKEHTTATLEDCINYTLWHQDSHPEQIKGLGVEALLDVFGDKGRIEAIRYKAAEVLAARGSPRLVPPTLKLLNSVLDSDADLDFETENILHSFINFLGNIHTPEAYQGLRNFVNRLLKESSKHKDSFLMQTVLAFAWAGIELDMRDSVSILKSAMPHFQHPGYKDLSMLVEYFDRFNDYAGIKEILTKHVTSGMPEVERKCLELLEKHDPEFVKEWRAGKATDETES